MRIKGVAQRRIARSLATILVLTFLQVVAAPIIAPNVAAPDARAAFDSSGLILNWDMQSIGTYGGSGSSLGDISGNSSTGTFTKVGTAGFPTFTSGPVRYLTIAGNSTNYNHVQSVDLKPKLDGYASSAASMQNVSIFTWVYPTANGIVVDELNGTGWQDSQIEMADGKFSFRVWGSNEIISDTATPLNYWYYVGLTYDYSTLTLRAYINGKKVGEQTNLDRQTPWENSASSPIYYSVGRYDATHLGSASGGNFRFGALQIYNRALSQSSIEGNYQYDLYWYGPTIGNPGNISQLANRVDTFTVAACAGTKSATSCSYKWEVSSNGGTTWSTVGASSLSYPTGVLTADDNGKIFRVTASDPGAAGDVPEGIRNYAVSASATLSVSVPPGSDTDTALLLNGSTQYAEKSDVTSSPYDITGDITLQAWVYPTSDCLGDQGVVAKLNSYMLYCGSSGYWKYVFDADGLNWSGSVSGLKVRKNEWHHMTYVKSGTSLLIYVDGNLAQTITGMTATMGANNDAFQIGRFGTSSYFQGEIDEVRVYKSARTQAQILSDMHTYGPTSDANLAAYYDFNEGTGSTLYNRSQSATSVSDMVITGSPLWADIKTVDPSTVAAYTIVKFDRSYLTSTGGWKVPSGVMRVRALVIAGGGGGGSDEGGGGGAGGFIDTTTIAFGPNAVARITVGAGGNGAEGNDLFDASNGQDSILDSLVAVGGGGGGSSVNTNLAVRNGSAGGSGGGGAGESLSNRAGGAGTLGQGFAGGIGINAGSGGGGGGATEAGNTDGNGLGGDGKSSDITGATVVYSGGGGGGNGNTGATSYAGGDGGGGRGGSSSVTALGGTAGLGGGGGGAGSLGTASNSVAFSGADGGSGVIIIRYITASKPIFTQPQSDTTTAGLVDTITVSANPITPLTRNYQWQVSTDTGTTWINASTGFGITSNTYTTPILETNTSGSRYQYRVIVTDSDTAGLFIVDTSVAVFIVVNPRITYTGSYTAQKYGSTHQDTFTVLNGTGNKTFAYSPNNRTGITWTSPSANTAVLTIGTTLFVGTYFETITATDTKGAQTTLALSIVVTKADTVTVTAIARSETYTGSTLSFTPSFTVSGLKNSDTVTAASMSWNYNGVENSGTLYSIQSTRPTNAGSYMITPVAPASLTDSYTAVSVVTAALTVNRATRTISITPPGSPVKFGETKTVTATPSAGSGDGAISFATTTSDSCTVSTSTVTAIKSSGTCVFTATIARGNNYETATSTSGTSSLTKADTLTVTVDAMNPLTYTGAQIGITPSVTVSGLKLTNSVGATPTTIKYASSGGGSGACASGGACAVGDTGPGGGIVFYDAGSQQSWGRYLEIAKSGWGGAGETTAKWCSTALNATALNVVADGIGQGLINSTTIANSCGEGAAYLARTYNGGGKSNWYLPTSAEFALMYTNQNVIDLSTSTLIWLSQEANDANMNWVARVGALSSSGVGGNNKIDTLVFRPIRAFAAGDTAQDFILTKPTDADTYTVRASGLTLSIGSLSDYQGVTYVDATLRVNRAQQAQLFLAEYGAIFGTPYKVIVFGGSGTGAAKVSTASGSATGCTVSGDTLTSTSVGTCLVNAVKAQDKNYETATVSISVYFLDFVIQQSAPPASSGPGIALSGSTAVTLDPNQAPTISSISVSSGRVGDTVTISGVGFTASALQSVKFWRNILASIQGTPTNTQIIVLVPSGATTGKILVTTVNGSAVTEGAFTVLP